ncbi:MAG: SusC/RagA family TonB-linked outer membrane protein [Gemmatimonas sp.]|nr:SusC/RagA family TonB-linked outer membrane protein [Gemmatimonas sp.]
MRTLCLLILGLSCFLPAYTRDAHGQQGQVSGTVIDQLTAAPIASASVQVQGTNIGTLTDAQGRFAIPDVPAGTRTIVAQRIGYVTGQSEVTVSSDGTAEVSFALTQAALELDEIVVVGYGTAERRDVTGAVDQVNGELLSSRPVPNLTQGLQGMLPNVNIRPLDGKPIQSPEINIRGTTSIGTGGNALVLIDGVEGDLAMLNPNDVESVTVLKDAASAAVYGARGAFGVVLITTKRPSADEFSVTYGTTYGVRQPVSSPDFVTDGYTYAKMFNQAFENGQGFVAQNVNKTLLFSEEYLAELERRSQDPSLPAVEVGQDGQYAYYGSTDWYGLLYRDRSPSMEHNVSISRGTETTKFMVSGRYLTQDGLFRYNSDDFRMMNLRANGSARLTGWLELSSSFDYSNRTYHNPLNVGEGGGIWRNIADEGHPLAPLFNPDGTLTHSAAYTVGDFVQGKNGLDFDRTVYRNTTELAASLFDNRLQLTGDFTFQKSSDDEEQRRVPVPYSRAPGSIEYVGLQYNDLQDIHDNTDYLATNLYGSYETILGGNHSLGAMVGVNYEERTWDRLLAQRNGLIFSDVSDLSLALGQATTIDGGYEKWNILGGFTRLNYSYGDRYLLEFTARYDGSSKFPEDQRYALFPSVSGAWRLSQEPFWQISPDLISDLRLRASYGSMGNGNVDPYAFQETFDVTQADRIVDGVRPAQTENPTVLPAGLTWETATTRNFGLDLDMFSNRLTFSGDVYVRETTDMYTVSVTPPAVFGADAPKGNYADLRTTGWEFSLGWQDAFELAERPATYGIRLSLSDYQAKILKYNNPNRLLNDDDYREGQMVGEIWGYVTEGFFESEADIANHADQSYFSPNGPRIWHPGDLKFRDLNGDGVVGPGLSTLDDPGDRTIIGNTTPRYSFGVNLQGSWGDFSLSSFFQGVGKQNWHPSSEANHFWGQYNRPYNDIPKWHLEEGIIWTEENPNPDAFFPRYTGYAALGGDRQLGVQQSKYVMNAAYVRLKNVQLGYSLPEPILSRFGFRAGDIYVSAENLWTYSPLYDIANNVDVENITAGSDRVLTEGRHGYGLNYPMMKSLVTGITLTF